MLPNASPGQSQLAFDIEFENLCVDYFVPAGKQ